MFDLFRWPRLATIALALLAVGLAFLAYLVAPALGWSWVTQDRTAALAFAATFGVLLLALHRSRSGVREMSSARLAAAAFAFACLVAGAIQRMGPHSLL